MFDIKSFLLKPGPFPDIEKVNTQPERYFMDIKYTDQIKNFIRDLDFDYLHGAIYISYKNEVIMDFSYWDLVDQLWYYFCLMIEEYLEENRSEMYFPDMPVKIRFQKINCSIVLFSIDESYFYLPKMDFFEALLNGSIEFYEKMILVSSPEDQVDLCDSLIFSRKIKDSLK